MENGCNDQRSATGSWHQDAIGLLHPRLIANSDRPELQNTRLIMTCLNIQDAENAEVTQRSPLLQQSIIETLGAGQLSCAREFLLDRSLAFCAHRSGAFRIAQERDESFGHHRII